MLFVNSQHYHNKRMVFIYLLPSSGLFLFLFDSFLFVDYPIFLVRFGVGKYVRTYVRFHIYKWSNKMSSRRDAHYTKRN